MAATASVESLVCVKPTEVAIIAIVVTAVMIFFVIFLIIIHVPFFERHQSGYETQLLAFRFF